MNSPVGGPTDIDDQLLMTSTTLIWINASRSIWRLGLLGTFVRRMSVMSVYP